jgi:hypothetical protein
MSTAVQIPKAGNILKVKGRNGRFSPAKPEKILKGKALTGNMKKRIEHDKMPGEKNAPAFKWASLIGLTRLPSLLRRCTEFAHVAGI